MDAHRARIAKIAETLNNHDDPVAKLAADRLNEGRPAFWSNIKSHNGPASYLVAAVNVHGSIFGACAELKSIWPDRTWFSSEHFDRLLPLNPAAVADLQAAYRAEGTFRSDHELIRRTARVEGTYQPTIRAGSKARVDTTTEVLDVVAVDGRDAWLKDDVGNRITHRVEDLVPAQVA